MLAKLEVSIDKEKQQGLVTPLQAVQYKIQMEWLRKAEMPTLRDTFSCPKALWPRQMVHHAFSYDWIASEFLCCLPSVDAIADCNLISIHSVVDLL